MTRGQIALVHVAKRQLGLEDEEYEALLARAGASHANQLTAGGFRILMAAFEDLGFQSTSPRRPMGLRRDRASDAQITCIRAMWAQCTGGDGTEKGLQTWLEGKFKVSSVRFVSAADAPRVIAALRAWSAGRRAKGGDAA